MSSSRRNTAVESLESRTFFAATPFADYKSEGPRRSAAAALNTAAAATPAAKPALLSKLGTTLLDAADNNRVPARLRARGAATANAILIQATPTTTENSTLAADLTALGATRVRAAAGGRSVSALVPVNKLKAVANLPSLSFARPVHARTSAGAALSQGGASTRADIARATYGLNGAGVTVGILSDSFDAAASVTKRYADDVASGDLPADVTILSDALGMPGVRDEGRAMAQLIYDAAPGAKLSFATAFGTQDDFAAAIRALAASGADVLVDDVVYEDEPFFQDGPVAQAVDDVVAHGVSYFSAALNYGTKSYESTWRAGATVGDGFYSSVAGAPHFYGGVPFDFDPSAATDTNQQLTLGGSETLTISFQWDQPFASAGGKGAASDLDVYLLNASNQVVAASFDDNENNNPVEVLSFANPSGSTQTYRLVFVKYTDPGATPGPDPTRIKYVSFDQGTFQEWIPNASTAFGHTNAAGAESVAAAPFNQTPAFGVTPPVVEFQSSLGGTPILFDTNGNRLATPVVRQTPSITSASGGNNTFFGTDSAADADTLPNFFGTSAAAAEAAGVAALLLQRSPGLTPAQLYAALESTAVDMDNPDTAGFDTGFDHRTGFGLIRADAAVAAITTGSLSGSLFRDYNGNDTLDAGETFLPNTPVYLDANGNNTFDATTSNFTNNTAAGIPDNGTVASTIAVPSLTGVIDDVNVTLNITHPFVADLRATLISPAGTRIELFKRIGASGQNFTGTTFDDQAANSITLGAAPFTGSFKPASALDAFNGQLAAGTWTLEITDASTGDTGTLTSWSLAILSGERRTFTDETGRYVFGSLPTGTHRVRPVTPIPNHALTNPTDPTLTTTALSQQRNLGYFPTLFAGSTGNDTYTLAPSTAGRITITESLPTGTTVYAINPAVLPSLTFNTGTGNDTLTLNTTLSISPTIALGTGTDTLSVNAGTHTFNADLSAGTSTLAVNVGSGAVARFGATQHLAALNLAANATAELLPSGNRLLRTSSLTLAGSPGVLADGRPNFIPTATLDLHDNDLILDYSTTSSLDTVRQLLTTAARGDNGADAEVLWSGHGITSSTARALALHQIPGPRTTLALSEAALYTARTGQSNFAGEFVDGTTVLVKYTYAADADLSGRVNNKDVDILYASYQDSRRPQNYNPFVTTRIFSDADFNYDGKTDDRDLDLLASTVNPTAPIL